MFSANVAVFPNDVTRCRSWLYHVYCTEDAELAHLNGRLLIFLVPKGNEGIEWEKNFLLLQFDLFTDLLFESRGFCKFYMGYSLASSAQEFDHPAIIERKLNVCNLDTFNSLVTLRSALLQLLLLKLCDPAFNDTLEEPLKAVADGHAPLTVAKWPVIMLIFPVVVEVLPHRHFDGVVGSCNGATVPNVVSNFLLFDQVFDRCKEDQRDEDRDAAEERELGVLISNLVFAHNTRKLDEEFGLFSMG